MPPLASLPVRRIEDPTGNALAFRRVGLQYWTVSGEAKMLSALAMQCPSCSPKSMLVRKDPETAPLCPQCGDAMRLARKLPAVLPLSGLVVHLCGGCGYVGTAEREPDAPPLKWLRPTRGVRYSLFPAGTRERQ